VWPSGDFGKIKHQNYKLYILKLFITSSTVNSWGLFIKMGKSEKLIFIGKTYGVRNIASNVEGDKI